MKHFNTIFVGKMNKDNHVHGIGCGECQTSCQSACKTSCTVANQNCEKEKGTSPLRRSAAKPVTV